MRIIHLNCVENGVEVFLSQPTKHVGVAKTKNKLAALLKKAEKAGGNADAVMCSSSLDFPEEYTKDKNVINLCNWIRNGE